MIDPQHDKRIRLELFSTFALCIVSFGLLLLSLLPQVRPHTETLGSWFQRSGALTTAFAVFAQFKASGVARLIAGGMFAESWNYHRKYTSSLAFADWLSFLLIIIGTVVWGYGDLLIIYL